MNLGRQHPAGPWRWLAGHIVWRLLIGLLSVLLSGLATTRLAAAHESLPASLLLDQQDENRWTVRWRLPAMQGPAPAVQLRWEGPCAAEQGVRGDLQDDLRTDLLPGALLQTRSLRCPLAALQSSTVHFDGLEASGLQVLVRVRLLDGQTTSDWIDPRQAHWQMRLVRPASAVSAGLELNAYFGLGLQHILGGWDHLLFVLGLVLLVPALRSLVGTITAFTLAHSLTLGAAALGWLQVPPAPTEAVIALSIAFLARELLRPGAAPSLRRPWVVAFCFGLLHGLGFASGLSEVGLPPQAVPAALLLFNLGVEAGQLLFIAGVLSLRTLPLGSLSLTRWSRPVLAYTMGTVATFWWLQRMPAVLGWSGLT